MPSSTSTARPSSSGKPSHVKIMKKNELDILNQSLKKNKSRQEISRINRDVTQRLYNEIDIKKNYLRIIKEKAKKDKNEEIDPELTLKPQINKISKFIAEGRRASGRAIEDYLIEEGRKAGTKRSENHNRKILK